MMEELAPMIATVAILLCVGYVVKWTSDNRRQLKLAQMHLDLHNKLLDKFGSSQELSEYLNSDAGRQYLTWVPMERTNPYAKILGSIQWGVILLTAGAAFFLLRNQIEDAFEGFSVLGVLGIALGVGFLVSAGIAYALSKAWGVIDGERPQLPRGVS